MTDGQRRARRKARPAAPHKTTHTLTKAHCNPASQGPQRWGLCEKRAPSLAARQRGAHRAGRAPCPPAGMCLPGLEAARERKKPPEKIGDEASRRPARPAVVRAAGQCRTSKQAGTRNTPGAPGARPQRRQPQTRPEGRPRSTGAGGACGKSKAETEGKRVERQHTQATRARILKTQATQTPQLTLGCAPGHRPRHRQGQRAARLRGAH